MTCKTWPSFFDADKIKSSIEWILPGVNTGLNGREKRGRLYFLPVSYRLHSILLSLCRSDRCVLDFSLVCHSFDNWRIDRRLNTKRGGGGRRWRQWWGVRNWLPTRPLGCAWEFLRQLTTKIWPPALSPTIKGRRIKKKAGVAQTMGLNGSAGKVFFGAVKAGVKWLKNIMDAVAGCSHSQPTHKMQPGQHLIMFPLQPMVLPCPFIHLMLKSDDTN